MVETKRMPIGKFMVEVRAALNRKDGYIMGSKGQDPKKWAVTSWWYTQYTGAQKTKALYWREHAAHVWDCNGLAEGIYEEYTGVNINTRARSNYAQWCGTKGTGMIPAARRCEGAAVFWGSKASDIHHVAYLDRPVDSTDPDGDWYIIEARGVMYGVIRTRLYQRKPNFWGLMTKYFDYADATSESKNDRILKKGMGGSDVKQMQEHLIQLGYDCGKWGADGEFGSATETALKAFQRDNGCAADGEYGPITHAAMLKALESDRKTAMVIIVGGQCFVRTAPTTNGGTMGVAKEGTRWPYAGQTSQGWHKIDYNGRSGWVSGKYGKLEG